MEGVLVLIASRVCFSFWRIILPRLCTVHANRNSTPAFTRPLSVNSVNPRFFLMLLGV